MVMVVIMVMEEGDNKNDDDDELTVALPVRATEKPNIRVYCTTSGANGGDGWLRECVAVQMHICLGY